MIESDAKSRAESVRINAQGTHRHGEIFAGIFFALTGALLATSIFNVGKSGIPVFWLTFPLAIFVLLLPGSRAEYFPFSRGELSTQFLIGITVLFLCLATFFHLALDMQSLEMELPHATVRLSFLLYCSICIFCLRGNLLASCLYWLRRFLAIFAAYGIYQLPAKLLGFPLFLDWLRNNLSFDIYHYDTAGWITIVRATSIYPEPSLCILPCLVLLLLNIYLPASKVSKFVVWMIAVLFSLLTFSRTIWISELALAAAIYFSRKAWVVKTIRYRKKTVFILLVALILIFPLWSFSSRNYRSESDLSNQERAGSIVIGLDLIKKHPIVGSGWNSYETLMPSYQGGVEDVSPEVEFSIIHNMFVSYAEQAGIGGFVLGMLPLCLMLFASRAPIGLRLGSVASLLTAAEIGGDVAYSSLFWLWTAIVVNWDS